VAEKSLTKCCQMPAYWEPLYAVGFQGESKRRFGAVMACSKCRRLIGEAKLDWKGTDAWLKAAQKAFNGTSTAMMIDEASRRPGSPLNFKMGPAKILIPEIYGGELKAQTNFNEEGDDAPF